tara:strand:+ start:8261 stop:9013 length:753 start_codon:yes stop_codon:yes gene_type:complete
MLGNGKYVSIEPVLAKVYRDMGMTDGLDITDAIEWAGEAMEFIGATVFLDEKVRSLDVVNYKTKLPVELHYINTVAGVDMKIDKDECDTKNISYKAMRYTTDSYHHWRCGFSEDSDCDSDLTYTVNDDYLFPNFSEGKVLVSYMAMPVDDRGYPKIPDDVKFKEAVASHIKWRLGFIKWMSGKMPGAVYQKLEQDRDWYIGAAQSRDKMPSVDMAESIKNNWLRLIPKINQHGDGHKSAGEAEKRNTLNS